MALVDFKIFDKVDLYFDENQYKMFIFSKEINSLKKFVPDIKIKYENIENFYQLHKDTDLLLK